MWGQTESSPGKKWAGKHRWRRAECKVSVELRVYNSEPKRLSFGRWTSDAAQKPTVSTLPSSVCAHSSMARIPAVFLLCACVLGAAEGAPDLCRGPHCFPSQDWSRPCVGSHCPGRRQFHQSAQPRPGLVHPALQQDAQHGQQQAPVPSYTVIQPRLQDGRRTNPRTLTAEVFHPGCAGGTCATTVTRQGEESTARECKGIGCKLPSRMRQQQQQQFGRVCTGDGCGAHGEDDRGAHGTPVHVTDRAAQFLGELPDFGSERGAWIQLTCDMKPGGCREVARG